MFSAAKLSMLSLDDDELSVFEEIFPSQGYDPQFISSLSTTLPQLPSALFSERSKNTSFNEDNITFSIGSDNSGTSPTIKFHQDIINFQFSQSTVFSPYNFLVQPRSIQNQIFEVNLNERNIDLNVQWNIEDPLTFLENYIQSNSKTKNCSPSEVTFCLEAEDNLQDVHSKNSVTTYVAQSRSKNKFSTKVSAGNSDSHNESAGKFVFNSLNISRNQRCPSVLCETRVSSKNAYAGSGNDFRHIPCAQASINNELSFRTRSYLSELAYPDIRLSEASSAVRLSLKSFVMPPKSPVPSRRSIILRRIEITALQFLDDLVNERVLKLSVRCRSKWSNFIFVDVLTLKSPGEAEMSSILSGKTISVNIFILDQIYQLVRTNTTCSKRELFYRNPEIAKNQNITNRAIQDMACVLDADPWELGILSSCKGLVAGSLTITLTCGTVIECRNGNEASALPFKTTSVKDLETTAKCVILVEKDTVFRKLLQDNILHSSLGNIIILTGKGYPDINTRYILKKIWEKFNLPIYALMDADPFGIEILLIYRFGSMSMSKTTNCMAVPSIKWIGVHPTEIDTMNIPHSQLTQEDHNRLNSLLKRPYISGEILQELTYMRQSNKKAEIEGISRISDSLLVDEYIPKKIDSIRRLQLLL